MSKIINAMNWCIGIANDDSHGYSQSSRWGADYDCSSLIIQGCENAGIPLKSNGATYTGNIKSVALKTGFEDATSKVNLTTGSGLQQGDIILKSGHVVMYIGNGRIVHASINELGKVTGGQTGDQTGKEICTRSYYKSTWHTVLRYTGEGSVSASTDSSILRLGSTGTAVKEMQTMLLAVGYDLGKYGADGDFGNDTKSAVCKFQSDYGLEVDGEYGPISKAKLTEVYGSKTKTQIPIYARGKTYTLNAEMKVRTGAGTSYRAKTHSELTEDGQKHDADQDGALDKGTRVTCKGYTNVGNDIWILTPSGWLAAYYNGKQYIS